MDQRKIPFSGHQTASTSLSCLTSKARQKPLGYTALTQMKHWRILVFSGEYATSMIALGTGTISADIK
jgi:hypothetical protein